MINLKLCEKMLNANCGETEKLHREAVELHVRSLRHVKKIWFSPNQARTGLKRLGYASICPKKNFKSLAGLEPS